MKSVLSLIVCAGFLVTGCGNGIEHPGGSGLIESTESVVSAETAGRLLAMYVDEGSTVAPGDTLALIDTVDVSLSLRGARARLQAADARLRAARTDHKRATEQLSFAATELERVKKLQASGSATDQQLDRVTHEHTQASIAVQSASAMIATIEAEIAGIEAEIGRLQELRSDCTPVSPIGGVITERYIELGELLTPGRPIVKVARLDTVEVKVYLPTGQFANVSLGDSASVDTESGGKLYSGRVVWTSQEAEFTPKNVQTAKTRANLVYAVKVEVPNGDGDLKIGMPVYVTLHQR